MAQASSDREGEAWALIVYDGDRDVPERLEWSLLNASFVGCIYGVDKRHSHQP